MFRARERGIYILFNPNHTYNAGSPEAMGYSFPGFAALMNRLPALRAVINFGVGYDTTDVAEATGFEDTGLKIAPPAAVTIDRPAAVVAR